MVLPIFEAVADLHNFSDKGRLSDKKDAFRTGWGQFLHRDRYKINKSKNSGIDLPLFFILFLNVNAGDLRDICPVVRIGAEKFIRDSVVGKEA